jgi:hypothetical protein
VLDRDAAVSRGRPAAELPDDGPNRSEREPSPENLTGVNMILEATLAGLLILALIVGLASVTAIPSDDT